MKRFVSLVLMVAVLVGCFGITGEAKSRPIRITRAGDVKHGKVKITTNSKATKVVCLSYVNKRGKTVNKIVKITKKKTFTIKVPKNPQNDQFCISLAKKKDVKKKHFYVAMCLYWGDYAFYIDTQKI